MFSACRFKDNAMSETEMAMQIYLSSEAAIISEKDAIACCLSEVDHNMECPYAAIADLSERLFNELSIGIETSYCKQIYNSLSLSINGMSDEHEGRAAIELEAEFDCSLLDFKIPKSIDSYFYLVNKLLRSVNFSTMPIEQAVEYLYLLELEYYEAINQYDIQTPVDTSEIPTELINLMSNEYGFELESLPNLIAAAKNFEDQFGVEGSHCVTTKNTLTPSNSDLNDPSFNQLLLQLDTINQEQEIVRYDFRHKVANWLHENEDNSPLCFHTIVITGTDIELELHNSIQMAHSNSDEKNALTVAVDSREDLINFISISIREICVIGKIIDAYNKYAESKGYDLCTL